MNYKDIVPENFILQANSLNSLSPYIGRLRQECAEYLIRTYADPQKPIFDPFCGSGTVLLQGWSSDFDVLGNDLNPYAYVLTMGKLFPYRCEKEALQALESYKVLAEKNASKVCLCDIPDWVKSFYDEKTLQEIVSWTRILKRRQEWFLLSCLLGIMHHQRPGFLSYPASHGAPYLRANNFPRAQYPEMYVYKNVYEKLSQKIHRVYCHFPELDYNRTRVVFNKDASKMRINEIPSCTIITSPPYMRSLTYARDNRLRLWFLGEENWEALDNTISPRTDDFENLMVSCFRKWARLQEAGDKCVVVIGDLKIKHADKQKDLAHFIKDISDKNYTLVDAYQDPVSEAHKLVKGNAKIKRELIVVLERK